MKAMERLTLSEFLKNNDFDFSTEVPAKWVLSGEHSVLQGKRALAFPYFDYSLKLFFKKSEIQAELRVVNQPQEKEILALVDRAFDWLQYSQKIKGELLIQSSIPMGSGLGSSAALCVAIARFALHITGKPLQDCVKLATHLEDVFHGKSSGMDVSVIAESKPVFYSLKDKVQALTGIDRIPSFLLYDTGFRGQTRACIQKVNEWRSAHPDEALIMDEKMGNATDLAEKALLLYQTEPEPGKAQLAFAMNQAQACMEAWGLMNEAMLKQKNKYLNEGALAVKLTGAGMGGFLVVLPNF